MLELNENPGDQELIARVFRALHTLKGSGAMFGFEALAAFTHKLETAFQEVRDGRLQLNSELIDLTLSALDQIRAMVEDGQGAAVADPEACAEILAKVQKLTGSQEPAKTQPEALKQQVPPPGAGDEIAEWAIHFAPDAEYMKCGANPFLLLRELQQLGGLSAKASMAAVSPLKELDPERCYVSWEMVLATAAKLDAIRDVFIFVEDSCELSIKPLTTRAAAPEATCAADVTAKALDEKANHWRSAQSRHAG